CEANFLGDYIHNQVWKTMKPQLLLVAEYNLEPCQNFQCTSTGFTFDNIPKYNWSYVEFLSTKFGSKEKGKSRFILNWHGPDTQCWCKNILYRSKSWCKQCYTDCRIWNALKQIPIRKLAICYEETSIQKETESMELFSVSIEEPYEDENYPTTEDFFPEDSWSDVEFLPEEVAYPMTYNLPMEEIELLCQYEVYKADTVTFFNQRSHIDFNDMMNTLKVDYTSEFEKHEEAQKWRRKYDQEEKQNEPGLEDKAPEVPTERNLTIIKWTLHDELSPTLLESIRLYK